MEYPVGTDPSVIKKAIITTFETFPENLRKYIAHVKPRYLIKYEVLFNDFFSKYERNLFTFTKYIFSLKHQFMYCRFSVAICAVCTPIILHCFFFNRLFFLL